ncbi:hypothetical protein CNEO4_210006 [Clostridium neonatale]|nr:hypothetical protein CNEO4_160006 [Clostridium neonatale]CAI3582720.1 hypothetical protein CNEO4_210006 [Clostridium neonatale]
MIYGLDFLYLTICSIGGGRCIFLGEDIIEHKA